MTAPRPLARGNFVLVRFPYTDLSSEKVRPALIVGRVTGEDLVLAFITSRTQPFDHRSDYLLRPTDPEFALTGLKTASIVRLDKLVTLHRSLVRRRLGHAGPETGNAIAAALRFVFEL